MKCLRIGVTESAMLLALKYPELPDKFPEFISRKLWYNWNAIGFYDTDMSHPLPDDPGPLQWDVFATSAMRAYWAYYLQSCANADIVIHLRRSILDADMMFGDGRGLAVLATLFAGMDRSPRRVEERFCYGWVSDHSLGRRVIVVSPFARLIKQQADSGNLSRIRPAFVPREMLYYTFPYCFGNTGPHANSMETIRSVSDALLPESGPGTTILLSCGSMGVGIADRLAETGADVFYCGGAMQLFFGLMGERWRRKGRGDLALHPADDLLRSFETNPELWVDPIPAAFVPSQSHRIEKGCYW